MVDFEVAFSTTAYTTQVQDGTAAQNKLQNIKVQKKLESCPSGALI